MRHTVQLLALLALWPAAGAAAGWPTCESQPLPDPDPQRLGIDAALGPDLQALLDDAVARRLTQAAALVVLHRGQTVFRGGAGGAGPQQIFDVASLTKVVATAPSVMQLVTAGKTALVSPAWRHLSLLAEQDKRPITVRQLLAHTAGLHSVVWAGKPEDDRPLILERIRRSRLRFAPGASYRYSDLGYILLGELVEALSGQRLDAYARARLFEPLGMCATGFNPPPSRHPRLVTPWPRGEQIAVVYDPLAARMAGVAGHAGLYATADDLARFGAMMLGGGALAGKRVLSERAVRQLTRPQALPGATPGQRGLGWDISSPHAASKGALSARAYGHTGYTGTSLWIDPELELVVVLLTNRTYYEPAPSINELRRQIHTLLARCLSRPPPRPLHTGLDQLVASGLKPLQGRRVGLITNRTAIDAQGRWIGQHLLAAPGVELRTIFTPEHGLDAVVDRHIRDGALRHEGRKIPIYSLFGRRRRPTAATLEGIDTLVFDVQTVGVRYYTYLATMGWAMEEAARHGLRFVVLDRPSPLGGEVVQGPLSDPGRRTSTNYHPLPVRYGMTLGELARLYNAERRLGVKLQVIPVRGWRRAALFHQQGLPWRNPSPNIRSWRQALLYAGVGLLETTNLAVGRGTDSPFMLLGAPWIEGEALARRLARFELPGILGLPTTFTPAARPYRGKRCSGLRLVLLDPVALDPVALGVALALSLRELYPEKWQTKNLYRLISDPQTTAAILAGKPLAEIRRGWQRRLRRFRATRRRYLLYR